MTSPVPSSFLYQAPSDAALKVHYINKRLIDLQAPAAIIDVAVVRKNCNVMLDTAKSLRVQFRAHVKTHKTVELSKLQVGSTGPIRLITSTISEIEHLLPWLLSSKVEGRAISVLYGLPPSPSTLARLARLAHVLGDGSISLLIDHPDTLNFISQSYSLWPGVIPLYIKIDTGYGRSGTSTTSPLWKGLLQRIEESEADGVIRTTGLYSHFGHSYAGNTPMDALTGLKTEFGSLASAATELISLLPRGSALTLSVGATPTAIAAQNLLANTRSDKVNGVLDFITSLQEDGNLQLELHAGVYPLLDMQQLATHATPSNLSYHNLGLRILAEVASLYPNRSKPEALIAAGSLVLGREPCKSYPGWGVVTPWPHTSAKFSVYDEQRKTGWIVGRVSQEHGILSWEGPEDEKRDLQIGDKVLIWPNHACVAGVGFGWYYVVDSDKEDKDVVRDIWVRCRGW